MALTQQEEITQLRKLILWMDDVILSNEGVDIEYYATMLGTLSAEDEFNLQLMKEILDSEII